MAVLPDADRAAVWADYMRDRSNGVFSISKNQLRTLIDAADTWVDSNRTSYGAALTAAVPGHGLTASQQAGILKWVLDRRFGTGV